MKHLDTIKHFYQRELWQTRLDKRPLLIRICFHVLRTLAITTNGTTRNRIASHAAALAYSTLIALGPMVAVGVMVSGYVLQDRENDLIEKSLQSVVGFISVPTTVGIDEEKLSSPAIEGEGAGTEAAATQEPELNANLVSMFEHMIESTRSGAVGVIGSIVLIFISIQLISTIENSLNLVWGVNRGRKLPQRIMLYWAWLSLGTVLVVATLGLVSVGTAVRYIDQLPWGENMVALIEWGAPLLSVCMVIGLLAIFYKFLPNINVTWVAALTGALLTSALLFLNKELSFLYADRVIRAQNLYGSIGIIPVFMFGIYLFWLFVLLGGQLSYAVQNVHAISGLKLWEEISHRTREAVSLAALLHISRRFKSCEEAPKSREIAESLRVPQHVLNGCLQQLCEVGLLNHVTKQNDDDDNLSGGYQPARPLEAITLGEFKRRFEQSGNDEAIQTIHEAEPFIGAYQSWLEKAYVDASHLGQDINTLIAAEPIASSAAP